MVLVGILVAVFGAFFLKKNSATTTTTAATTAMDTSGLAKDANGNPILYRDTTDTFINTVSGSYNTTTNPTVTEHPIEPTSQTAYVRTRYSSPSTKAYDDKNPGGVPIRATPDGKITRLQPFGTSIQIEGTAVSGGTNFKNGSSQWIQVASGGYISAYDVTGVTR